MIHLSASAYPRHFMLAVESVLSHLSLFEPLRADEVARIARRFTVVRIEAGTQKRFAESADDARLVVVVEGSVTLTVEAPAGALTARMDPGDRFGAFSLLTGHAAPFTITPRRGAVTVAVLDAPGFDAVLEEFPAASLPLAVELASELAVRHDVVRQLVELHAEQLPAEELKDAIDERRDMLVRRGARVTRLSTRALFRKLVVQEGAEPPFWMLLGFLGALGGARLVVHLILKYHLEKQLFALVPGTDPNPMHVHHFNYGLILIGSAGLAALFPFGRRALRALSLAFGIGCGLVFDEFALFWNLNPEYAQGLSLFAAGMAAAFLIQLTYFRHFWAALVRRGWLTLRGVR